eukprot:TRINITY_DN67470_c0_g1_i1.p1 TRINITY_DN67470_c0_g1~~TRINITY_DN67470_c0_g1_i1.p1  ORF type:complete len:241 (-),score=7.30 TRINITY_DN67470_c0_g1_i1:175-897(-)
MKHGNVRQLTYIGEKQQWLLLVEDTGNDQEQQYLISEEFPRDQIAQSLADGFYVKSISYGDGKWVVITEFRGLVEKNNSTQQIYTTQDDPHETINGLWRDGFHVDFSAFGAGLWVIVADVGLREQRFDMLPMLPKKKINEYWQDGYIIVSLTFMEKGWLVVGEKVGYQHSQQLYSSVEYPQGTLDHLWNAPGGYVHMFQHGDNRWAMLTDVSTAVYAQRIYLTQDIPTVELEAEWGLTPN